MVLTGDRDGHFQADARVDGRSIDFMVDTGASLVIMRESDAARVGILPMRRATTPPSSPPPTARSRRRRAKLDRVEIGDITVFDVPALVLPDEALAAEPARRLIPVAAQALRIRQRPHGARAVAFGLADSCKTTC